MAVNSSTTKSIVKKKKPSGSTTSLQVSNIISDKDDRRISVSEINGSSNKRKVDQVVSLVPKDGDKGQGTMDPSMRWKPSNTGASKTPRVQPNKKQRMTMMISVPSPSDSGFKKTADHQDSIKAAADHQDSIKAKLSRGSGLISKPARGIEKINNAQEDTCPKSSSSCGEVSGDPVCCVNKIRVVDDDQIVKKALQAAKKTSRFAEIFSKSKARDLQNERDRQKAEIFSNSKARDLQNERDRQKRATELREKREAARIALEMMEKTVEIEDNLMILKEFEMLIRSPACA